MIDWLEWCIVPEDIKSALAAYQQGEKVASVLVQSGVTHGTFYWWVNRLGIAKRGRRENWRKPGPDPHVKAAIEAYRNGVEVRKVGVPEAILYYWLDRQGVPRRGRSVSKRPSPRVLKELRLYESGVAPRYLKISDSSLYRWLHRTGIQLQQPNKTRIGKRGPKTRIPYTTKCDWCGDPLTEAQSKQRNKYCCWACQEEAHQKARVVGYCTAPGCGAEILDEPSPCCSWECFQAITERRSP